MKTNHNNKRSQGFTLIEMVGVLAVIAILAALLVPKIFAAIDESRYNNTVASCNGVKAAVMSYFAKQGKFPAAATPDFDQELITAGYLETPFNPKIGTTPDVETKPVDAVAPVWSKLDGISQTASGTVVFINLGSIPVADAEELSARVDGKDMSQTDQTTADDEGRVIYAAPAAPNGPVTCYVYLAHK